MKPRYILSCLACLCIFTLSYSQVSLERSVIGSAGMDFKNSQVQITATIGEAVTTTLNTVNITLTQGFQQPNKEDFTSSYRSVDLIGTLVSFPNPATERIYLDIAVKKDDDYHIEIFDVLGKRWKSRRGVDLDSGIERRLQFELNDVPQGHYFIRIADSSGRLAGSIRFLVQQ